MTDRDVALIARCREHKRRNVLAHLAVTEHAWLNRALNAAWATPDGDTAEAERVKGDEASSHADLMSASWVGSLIHATDGSFGGVGGRRPNRTGAFGLASTSNPVVFVVTSDTYDRVVRRVGSRTGSGRQMIGLVMGRRVQRNGVRDSRRRIRGDRA
jgi:hypothetical protein